MRQTGTRTIMLLLFNNVHEKKKTENQDRRNFESVRVLFVICTRVTTLQSCHNFARVLHENAIVFSNQKRVIFFMHVINSIKRRGVYFNSMVTNHFNF